MTRRRIAAGLALVALAACGVLAVHAEGPFTKTYFDGPRPNEFFIRQPDSVCKAIADTLAGPSVYCRGATRVLWIIRANSGTCSLFTAQVSNNDTTWQAAASGISVNVLNEFSVGESLNTGGQMLTVLPIDVANVAATTIPWRFSRLFVTRRTGSTSALDVTVLCRSRADSLRWTAVVSWPHE